MLLPPQQSAPLTIRFLIHPEASIYYRVTWHQLIRQRPVFNPPSILVFMSFAKMTVSLAIYPISLGAYTNK
jgi:hypothetical protein